MDILFLIVGDIEEDDRKELPLGIAFLCGQLKVNGYSYGVLDLYSLGLDPDDPDFYQFLKAEFLKKINTIDNNIEFAPSDEGYPRIIGISSTSYYADKVRKSVNAIRRLYQEWEKEREKRQEQALQPVIILGGYISLLDNILKRTNVDIVVHGEGEKILINLMQIFSKIKNTHKGFFRATPPKSVFIFNREIIDMLMNIKGLEFIDVSKKNQKVVINTGENELIEDLDKLAFPDFSPFDFDKYNFKLKKALPYYSQRGCYNHCSFCDIIPFYGKQFIRRTSPERVIKWIKYVKSKYDIERVDFNDDNFLNSRRWVERFFQLLKTYNDNENMSGQSETSEISQRAPLIKINFQARANEIIRFKDILSKYREFVNCIEIGTESFVQSQLDRWKKNITVRQNIECINILNDLGISYVNFYLWFDERTTIEELEENVETLLDLPDAPLVGSMNVRSTKIGGNFTMIPNYILNNEISAIYDREGRSSVRNIPHLSAAEEYLNDTYDAVKKLSAIYIGLKKSLEIFTSSSGVHEDPGEIAPSPTDHLKHEKIIQLKIIEFAPFYFKVCEELHKKRLSDMISLAYNIKRKRLYKRIPPLIKKYKAKLVSNYVNQFLNLAENILSPLKEKMGINIEDLIDI